jgi:hypothetical protein
LWLHAALEKGKPIPQGLKPSLLPSNYVGAEAPTPYAKHTFAATSEFAIAGAEYTTA